MERRASEAKLEFEQVSKLVKMEVARFEQERIHDFKNALQAFLDGMITRQKEVNFVFKSSGLFVCSLSTVSGDCCLGGVPANNAEESWPRQSDTSCSSHRSVIAV